ncbi:MAG: primosomal protein N' [Armatimonadota bacterium]|nr:primosomal protein N' [Armatimonadota bacterium]
MRVVVDAGSASMFDAYTYSIPESLAQSVTPGSCVLAPLGSREVIGYVVDFEATPPERKIKDIISVVDSPVRLEPELFRLAQWLSSRYLSPLPRCLRAVLPRTLSSNTRTMVRIIGTAEDVKLTPTEQAVLDALNQAGGELSTTSLKTRLRMASISKPLSGLQKKGIIEQITLPVLGQAKPRTVRAVQLNCSQIEAKEAAISMESKAKKRAAALRYCASHPCPILLSEVTTNCETGPAVISALVKSELLSIVEIETPRAPAFTRVASTEDLQLSERQAAAVKSICESIDRHDHSTSLLFGVTASGKTEVYLRALAHAVSKGMGAIVLVPEISLTTQVVDIFKSRFGDTVAVAHSYLSTGERFDEWRRISSGEARIVVGARSAIFAPVHNLGLVIIDEEHEPTYKQDVEPRYNARDAAIYRAETNNAAIVLGSATPSLESYYNALTGKYTLLPLPERVTRRSLPSVFIVDLKEEFAKGMTSVFSEQMAEAIRRRLEANEQIILFQNRRAYASFLLCRDCGFVMHCPNCAVALKHHRFSKLVRCHHCDFSQAAPDLCPKCQSRRFGGFGIGTERVEEDVRRCFPDASVLRMDRDTTSARGSHAAILNAFRRKEAQVLIGTQMVAKGLDFPGVTLVGVISADTSINLPDFRAAERTFQLLSQVAGRAGRGSEPGEVIIQSFNPDHNAIQCALRHDYVGFYEHEIAEREELNYPPFSHLVSMVASNEVERDAHARISELAAVLRGEIDNGKMDVEMLGPAPCSIPRLQGLYRWQLMLKAIHFDQSLALLKQFIVGRHAWRGISIDVDPAWML